jgi:urate oxidase
MAAFTYGKQSVPVFKIIRGENGKDKIIDMVVNIMLEGDIEDSWLSGNNKGILPTETQKNTCYALAMKTDFDSIEDYGKALLEDILRRHMHLSAGTVRIRERRWNRIGEDHRHAFSSSRDPVERTCEIRVSRRGKSEITQVDLVRSGVSGVKLLKTTQSGFDGFIRDKYVVVSLFFSEGIIVFYPYQSGTRTCNPLERVQKEVRIVFYLRLWMRRGLTFLPRRGVTLYVPTRTR